MKIVVLLLMKMICLAKGRFWQWAESATCLESSKHCRVEGALQNMVPVKSGHLGRDLSGGMRRMGMG